MLMTKPQFITAMRRCFGDGILKTESSFGKLFESFDFENRGQIDWRAVLYMLLILMQADMSYTDHLKWAFSIYSSEGMLDINKPSPLSLGTIKDFICVPLIPIQRKFMREMLDNCWLQLAATNPEVHHQPSSPSLFLLPHLRCTSHALTHSRPHSPPHSHPSTLA
jgi:hypothetical protein